MDIDKLMLSQGTSTYYDGTFRNVLEDYLTYLKESSTTSVLTVDPIMAYKYEFDLYSLLSYYSIPMHLHWLIMRMNGMVSPTDAGQDITELFLPSTDVVDKIRQSHVSSRRIS